MRANVSPRAPGREQAVCAIPRQQLVPDLLSHGNLVREQLGRKQPLDEVVVAEVAVASGEPEHTRDHERLEHGAHDVLRHSEPVRGRAVLGIEVECRERTCCTDALEHAIGDAGVLGEDRRVETGSLAAPAQTEPRVLRRRHERERLVRHLEDLTPLVEGVAPGRLVARNACVEHEVVIAPGHRERVEDNRAEAMEHLEHGLPAAFQRAGGREELPRDEEAPRCLGADLHAPTLPAPRRSASGVLSTMFQP